MKCVYPVKNVTGILMELPCHVMSQIDGSLVQIHTKFHDYSMSFIQNIQYPGFICCPCKNMTWILDKFKSWNFHDIC